jgi:glycosyltransferase involved in cell wall biosynthesis
MKILWVKNDFLHPTNRGGQIRSLETLKRLHRNHEIHYVAYDDPLHPEGFARAGEYSSNAYPVTQPVPRRGSARFFVQLIRNLTSSLPLAVARYSSKAMTNQIRTLLSESKFDRIVCDFLSVSPNIPDLARAVLFEHNVETVIWRRHAEHASDPIRKAYFGLQAHRMFQTERDACRTAAHVIAVSENDAAQIKHLFGVESVSAVPTGVDVEYFRNPHQDGSPDYDLVFTGAMDWMPNVDGARFFVREVLPLIRAERPDCTFCLAGRSPVQELRELPSKDRLITVTGTVPDIRPYLWNSSVSVVPLRIGGGTRLKIYESMAAGVPVVSTSVGAEGLSVEHERNILLSSDASAFAASCLQLLNNRALANRQAAQALELVSTSFSWTTVADAFEEILRRAA